MQRHRFQQRTSQEIIRDSNQNLKLQKWGFVVVRCTYSSQQKWEKFISILHSETLATFKNEADSDLKSTFALEVIEDEETLNRVDYKVARDRFDTLVRDELQAETDAGTDRKDFPDYITADRRYFIRIEDQPRRGFFIFADQEVVNSVVDVSEATLALEKKRLMQGGEYFVKVVRSGIEEKMDDDEEEDEEEEDEGYDVEEDGDSRRFLWQRFKAWDLVRLYASILQGGWPNSHGDLGYGICDILGL